MKKHFMPITLIVSSLVWIGFVCAISFLEAKLKFSAPGVTLGIGVGIGRLVFNALNKVEWFFAFSVLSALFFSFNRSKVNLALVFALPIGILIIQSFWLLPELDLRAELMLQKRDLPPSSLHFYYIILESIKVIILALSALLSFVHLLKDDKAKSPIAS